MRVRNVTTKMLTDLYGEHQRRGLSPGSVHKIHATISSMMSQACRWGWRDNNPAEWAEPPPLGDVVPEVPTPEEVLALARAASKSRRPVYGKVIFLAAIAGARRGEICALRARRDVNWESGILTIAHSIVRDEAGQLVERPTKNRRRRSLALDDRTLAALRAQCDEVRERAGVIGIALADDPFIFTDAEDGSKPWSPDSISQYFKRLRRRTDLESVQFKSLRRFMDTYGQELGFSLAQVAVRAGHDPAVASKHYTGKVANTDRELAAAISDLLA
jgi:integrase